MKIFGLTFALFAIIVLAACTPSPSTTAAKNAAVALKSQTQATRQSFDMAQEYAETQRLAQAAADSLAVENERLQLAAFALATTQAINNERLAVSANATASAYDIANERERIDSQAAAATAIIKQQRQMETAAMLSNIKSFVPGIVGFFLLIALVTMALAGIKLFFSSGVIFNEYGDLVAHNHKYQPVALTRSHQILPAQASPTPPPQQAIFLQDGGTSRLAMEIDAPGTNGRDIINTWLVDIENNLARLTRASAATYRIGHENADSIIRLALAQGYATKKAGRGGVVEPSVNFGDFVASLIYSQPPPTTSPTSGEWPETNDLNEATPSPGQQARRGGTSGGYSGDERR